ncbi:EIF3A [Symbiodinium natans]|uniref:EIF3A protein n=1 Tax=Symbiodinium natans TaxID=878477 RepID=A0A812PSX9_9DINO|nr:EIF3A [Symbiodinium natans]
MERVEVKAVASGKQGFVTLKGNQGTTYLQEFSPFTDFCTAMDKKIEERLAKIKSVTSFFTQKLNELAQHSSGPLGEAKAEILKLRPKASQQATEVQKLKNKVGAAKKDYFKAEEAERTAHLEAKERREAEALLAAAGKEVEAAEAEAAQVTSAAEPLVAAQGEELMKFEKPATVSEEVEKLAPAAAAALSKVRTSLLSQTKEIKALKGPLAEARKELAKLIIKVDAAQKKVAAAKQAAEAACKTICEAADAKASTALRTEAAEKGVGAEELFVELAGAGNSTLSHEALCKRLLAIKSLEIAEEHAKLVCRKIEAPTISKRSFLGFVQRYYVVTSVIAITSEFEISKAKTLRKADVDEIFEILEGPRSDEKLGVNRVRGRSLVDSTEGWLSIKGNQGSIFLKEAEKPFYTVCGTEEVPLGPSFKVGEGEAVRMLKSGEVMEMLEGPKKETFPPGLRAKCQALSDKATGWLSIRDKQGTVFAEGEGKFYTCVSTVAITDNLDIKDCKIIKKLQVGDLFAVEEGPVVQEDSGVTRVKGKTLEDAEVGWVTVKGNAGTAYATASKSHYAVVKEAKLQKTVNSNSELVRTLEVGETIKVTEGPKEEVHQAALRVKVKATSDGAVGWVTVLPSSVKRCTAKDLEALAKKEKSA